MIIHNKHIIVEETDLLKIIGNIIKQAEEINKKKAQEADRIIFHYVSSDNTFLTKYIHMAYKPVEIKKEEGSYYY